MSPDLETGEIDWHEVVRAENLTFQVCIENVVETVNTLGDADIQHEVYCQEMPDEQKTEEKDDK